MTSYKYQKQHASNYNYKTKRSFGQRIKNFFTIPEEDLKEEPSKEFEKIKLFTLTRGRLFLGILVFMILINILVAFNINFLYLRQIFGFLFLILVPGLLIMLCFKIRTVKFWEYLVYTVGLSIAFIMFAGLAVNWTLPALNITDKPLSLWPILICFDIFLIGLWLTAIYRNKDLKPFDITVPKLDTINNIFFIIPMIFPLLSILGAFLLNNHGPNILTMIMLGGIAVYVLLLVIFRKRMNENIWPWALWMIGLALLLSGWMRSEYLIGIDNNVEQYIFNLTYIKSFWSINFYRDAYNAMLSLNILPTIVNLFSINSYDNYIVFKLLFQIVFSFLPVILFVFFNKTFNKWTSFLSTLFFISIPMFYSGGTLGIRQEVAFIFFALMLLVLFSKEINPYLKKTLFLIFGFSMIVSHYSTSYITLAIFTSTYLLTLISKIYKSKKSKNNKFYANEKYEIYLTGVLVLLLIIFTFLWYSQVTSTSSGLIDFAGKSISNLGNIFKEDMQAGNQGILGNFLGMGGRQDPKRILDDYIEISTSNSSKSNFTSPYFTSPYKTVNSNSEVNSFLINIKIYTEFISRFIIILGGIVIFLFLYKLRGYILDKDNLNFYRDLSLVSLFVGGIFLILPFFSIKYDIIRFYNQIVLIISPLLILGFLILPKINKNKNFLYILISIFIIFYFLNMSGFFLALNNNQENTMRLSNNGREYNYYNICKAEYSSFFWAIVQEDTKEIGTDSKLRSRHLSFIDPNKKLKVVSSVLIPQLNNQRMFISGYVNKIYEFSWISYKNYWMSINFPTKFLNDNKNKVYNNGGSEIFQ